MQRPKLAARDYRSINITLCGLLLMLVLFSLSERLGTSPALIALAGGLSLFLFSGVDRFAFVNRFNWGDALFFTALFIFVGGVEATGLLHYLARIIEMLSYGEPWLTCLLLMWAAAFITVFFSAGPTAALLFPVVMSLSSVPGHHTIWWSLSLGILAGSCSSVIGATAGPVAASLVEDFSRRCRINFKGGNTVPAKMFAAAGVPLMFIFLIISSVYIVWLSTVF